MVRLLVSSAFAHASSMPHVHTTDLAGLAVVAAWILLGAVWVRKAARAPTAVS